MGGPFYSDAFLWVQRKGDFMFRSLTLTDTRKRSRRPRAHKTAWRAALYAEVLEDRLLLSFFQSPRLLLDINPGSASSSTDFVPPEFTQVNNSAFFVADDGTHGAELWLTNGSPTGTFMVRDIDPGPTGSVPFFLTNVNGTLFFLANDGTHGAELWKSNGTTAGTSVVADVFAELLTNISGTLFFRADDAAHGTELWKSNGTAAGTSLVADINPGTTGSYPGDITNVNGTLFFVAGDGTHGNELWKSNGTAAGTSMVADINTGSSFPEYLTNVNGSLFFSANDGTHGNELWKSNGSAAGTSIVADINPGMTGSYPRFLVNFVGTLYFQAKDDMHGVELWTSNGTAAGTSMVADINPGPSGSYPTYLTSVVGNLFFAADDGTDGRELWDYVPGIGAFLDRDVNPGPGGSSPQYLTNVNGVLFFSANDGSHGNELFNNDINPGPNSSNPGDLTNVNGALFFSADDGTFGTEPWIVPAGTEFLDSLSIQSSTNPSAFGQAVTFTASIPVGPGDPTPTGTVDFAEGTTDLTPGGVNLTDGQATFSTSALGVGGHIISASYSGDSDYSPEFDAHAFQVVNKNSTKISVLSGATSLVSGQSVAFVAIVSNTSGPFGAPTGSVQFKVDGTNLGPPVTLVEGVAASISTQLSASASPHTVTATYTNTDGDFLGGSGSLIKAVAKDATSLVLTASPNTSVFGQTVSFTATVSAMGPGSGTAAGAVDFKEDGTDLTPGGVTFSGGRATFSSSNLSVGAHTITATYSGDGNFIASSGSHTQAVNQATSRTVIFSFPDPSVFGQVVPFTVSVPALSPGKGTPTGSVVFTDFTTIIGTVSLSGGRATFTTASLSRGNHAISANYGGDGNFLASAYTNYGQTVQKAATTTAVTTSVNPIVTGQTLVITATVQAVSPGAGTATGMVTFMDNTTSLGTGTLNGAHQATFSTSALAVGTHAITASYGGDNNFTSSVSPILAEVVKTSALTAAISSPPMNDNARDTSPTLSQPEAIIALIPQRLDRFFGESGGKRGPLESRPTRLHQSVPLKDPLDWTE
jgi:ELWxxDGT repeat protein